MGALMSIPLDPEKKTGGSAQQVAIASARELRSRGDFDAALAAWRQVIAEFPGAPAGYIGTASVLKKMKRTKEANEVLSEGREHLPKNERIAVEHAWAAHHAADWPEANWRWAEVRSQFPASFDGYFGGGATLRALRLFDEAERLYAQALPRWPQAANLFADHALLASDRGDLEEAARRWAALRARFPDEPAGYLHEIRHLRAAGRNEQAEEMLATAAARFPEDSSVLIEYARIAQQRGAAAEALKRWDAVITTFHGLADGYIGAVHALNDLSRFADAQNVLLPALRMFPKNPQVAALNAWIAHYQKDFTEADKRWADIRERFPHHVPGYAGGAVSLLAMGLTAEAAALTEAGMAKFPDDVHMAMEWARVPQAGNDWEEAEKRWSSVLARFPGHAGVKSGQAWALLKKSKSVDAEILLKAAIAQAEAENAVDAPLLRSYAECAAERADWDEAESRWRDVIARFPDQAANWSGFAEMLRSAGRPDAADEVVDSALERFPGDMGLERQRALSATLRRDWPVALALWEDLKRLHPRHPEIQSGIAQALWQARQDLGVASSEGSAAPPFVIPALLLESGNKATGAHDGLDKLFLRFETIGDTCEFGIVQRRFGAEPISLLRWASTPPAKLVTALETDLAGVGDPEFTVIEAVRGEYISRDTRYHMFSHSFTPETAETLERFRAQHLRRMQFLRRKLLDDLAACEKIFVYKSNHGLSDAEAIAIHDAIRRYGGRPALLCVRLADQGHTPGQVDVMRDGLMMGYTDRFSTVDINVDVWVELCRKAATLWDEMTGLAVE